MLPRSDDVLVKSRSKNIENMCSFDRVVGTFQGGALNVPAVCSCFPADFDWLRNIVWSGIVIQWTFLPPGDFFEMSIAMSIFLKCL